MKRFLLGALLLAASTAWAQWRTDTYTLRGGWNAIYLHGDATHAPIESLVADPNVLEIWRWVPNPDQVMFTTSPAEPSAGTPEWRVWRRGAPATGDLAALVGQAAYLVKCAGPATATYALPLKNRPLPPRTVWVRHGANLLGFPSRLNGATYPTFGAFFATFPAAVAANSGIYKYVGGELGAANPLKIFSPAAERLDRLQAYWFDTEVVSNFPAPIEVELSDSRGLVFGAGGGTATVRVRNRSSAPVAVTLAPVPSEQAPAGQPAVTAGVPLTLRSWNSTTNQFEFTPVAAAVGGTVPARGVVEWVFGVDRGSPVMTAHATDPAARFASLLRITDGANLTDVFLPVSAENASLAGLWVGDATVTHIQSTVPGAGAAAAQPFSLRFILHVDGAGAARLLSQVFIGPLAIAPHELGLVTKEAGLKSDTKADARRLSVTHLPLDLVVGPAGAGNTGAVALGQTLTRRVRIPYDDPVNPFVHQYHPDHDNRDARFQSLPAGRESWNLTRDLSFTFASAPPPGESTGAWGATVIGGTYSETLTGAHRLPLTVSGTFVLRRASDLSALTVLP